VRDKQICRPFPATRAGHAVVVDATHVRLPELAQGESRLLHGGMEFRQLELLRPTRIAGLGATWPQNPLALPVAALPLGNGVTALVLDGQGSASRLVEVDLATGVAVRTLAQGTAGLPTALALDHDGQRVLFATDLGGSWKVFEVDLETGAVSQRVGGAATTTGGALRALLPEAATTALATAGNSVWRFDWSTNPPRTVRLRGNLATPWGMVEDPLRPGRVLIAERDANRIVSFDPQAGELLPVPATTASGVALPQPTSIVLGETGTGPQLVVLCAGSGPALRELRALRLGQQGVFALGTVPADAATVATGAAGLLLVALPGTGDLAAGGGIEQVRDVAALDVASATATVGSAFAPPVRDAQVWRIAQGRPLGTIRGTPAGAADAFLFDGRAVGARDRFLLNAIPIDAELGVAVATSVPRAAGNLDRTDVAVGDTPISVATADLDGDGDLDLVCANLLSDTLSVLYQNASHYVHRRGAAGGRGKSHVGRRCRPRRRRRPRPRLRQPEQRQSVDTAPERGAHVHGVDAPGGREPSCLGRRRRPRPRTAISTSSVANSSNNTLSVRYQSAPLTFTASATLAVGNNPSSVAAADVDGDGNLDLVCANEFSGTLAVLYQDAPQSFTAAAPLAVDGNPVAVAVADLDGDGDLDLVCANGFDNTLSVLYQDAPRTFTAAALLAVDGNPVAVAAADLDGDGDLDLVCAPESNDKLLVLYQDVPRTFIAAVPVAVGNRPVSVATADLDGDGDLDLVCANEVSDTLSLLYQGVPRAFTAPATLAVGLNPPWVAAADLDGDGDLDLVCGNAEAPTLSVLYQDAPRTFTAPAAWAVGDIPSSVAAADLDGDGDLDLACTTVGGTLTVLYQDAPRTFTAVAPLAVVGGPVSVVAADLDGDRDLDLVCATANNNKLLVLYQDAPRTFTAATPLTVGSRPVSVAAADLDGDGNLDLVCANRDSDTLWVLYQDAPRTFTLRCRRWWSGTVLPR
jgi:hypothetical protein